MRFIIMGSILIVLSFLTLLLNLAKHSSTIYFVIALAISIVIAILIPEKKKVEK